MRETQKLLLAVLCTAACACGHHADPKGRERAPGKSAASIPDPKGPRRTPGKAAAPIPDKQAQRKTGRRASRARAPHTAKPIPKRRADAALAYDSARKRVVLFGGCTPGQPGAVGDTWEWDGATWTQRFPAKSPGARCGASMAYDTRRARSVLFGGNKMTDTWEWDGTTWSQRRTATSPSRADDLVYDEKRKRVVVFDGKALWEWDGTTWASRQTTGPGERAYSALAYDARRQRLVLFGGQRERPNGKRQFLSDTWEWDGTRWTRRRSSARPSGRSGHRLAYDPARGRVVLFGGVDGRTQKTAAGERHLAPLADTWEWDGATWKRQRPRTSPDPRLRHALVHDGARGGVLLFGGEGAYSCHRGYQLQDTWSYNGSTWSGPVTFPDDQVNALAYDKRRGRLTLLTTSMSGASTWEWDGSSWAPPVGTGPVERVAAATYDAKRGRMVVFGGYQGGFSDLTWTWDGATWHKHRPVKRPRARSAHAMAYDARRGLVVLFGGGIEGAELSDTWEWDGRAWHERRPAQVPGKRSRHALAYAARQGRVVLFGGTRGRSVLSDTWEWDGTRWIQRRPAVSPGARWGHAMAYDERRDRVVLFGGARDDRGDHPLYDTWEWEGMTWTQRHPVNRPSLRSDYLMAYDTRRGRIALLGESLWEWDGTAWTHRPPGLGTSARAK